MANIYDEIRGIFEDLDERLEGPVTNLHGVVETADIDTLERQGQSWFFLSAPAKSMPSLNEFVNEFSFERPGHETVPAPNGNLSVRPSNEDDGRAFLLFGTVKLSGSKEFPIEVDAPGYDISININRNQIGAGRESLSRTPTLSEGTHGVAILFHGSTGSINVSTSPEVNVSAREPMPSAPAWARKSYGNYLDDERGVLATNLEWHNDPYAGAWALYKAQAEELARATTVTDNGDGTIYIEWDGLDFDLSVEDFLFTNDWEVGQIVNVTHDTNAEAEPVTSVDVRPSVEAPEDLAVWTDEEITYFVEGEYTSVAKISYVGGDVIKWYDTEVKLGQVYTYKVTAFGFITMTNESDYSDPDWVLAADTTPPGPLQIIQVVTERNVMRVTFLAPEDGDYMGARVYGPYIESTDPTGGTFSEDDLVKTEYGLPNRSDQVFFKVDFDEGDEPLDEPLRYYLTPFDASDNERDPSGASLVEFHDLDYLPPDHVTGVTATIDDSDPLDLGVFPRIIVTWNPPTDSRYARAEVSVQLDGGPWREVGTVEGDRFEYDGWWDTEHKFRVLSESSYGVTADPTTADPLDSITDTITTDSANSAFVGMFTESDQYVNNRPPNGEFFVEVDLDDDSTLEEYTLTPIGTLTA